MNHLISVLFLAVGRSMSPSMMQQRAPTLRVSDVRFILTFINSSIAILLIYFYRLI